MINVEKPQCVRVWINKLSIDFHTVSVPKFVLRWLRGAGLASKAVRTQITQPRLQKNNQRTTCKAREI